MSKGSRKSSRERIYRWLSLLTIFSIILAGFVFFIGYKVLGGNLVINLKSDPAYLTIIIAVAGFLAAFSAISIYSIFNANVDRERDRISRLRIGLETEIDKLKNIDKNIFDYLKRIVLVNDLTSPYSIARKKREAVKSFSSMQPVEEDIKDNLFNYYRAFESNTIESSKKYFIELQSLLNKWGKLDSDTGTGS